MFLGFHQLHLDSDKVFKFCSVLGEKNSFSQKIISHNQEAYLFDFQSSVSVPRFEQKHLQVRFRGKRLVCVALFSWLQSGRNNHEAVFVSTYANKLQIFLISKKKKINFYWFLTAFFFWVLGLLCRNSRFFAALTSKSTIISNIKVWCCCCCCRHKLNCLGFLHKPKTVHLWLSSKTTPWWLAAGVE